MTQAIGPLGIAPETYDAEWMQQFVERIEQIHLMLAQPAHSGYSVTNATATRVLDVDYTSGSADGEGAIDVLGTLIDDMKSVGRLSK
tara:strand:- start:598 stop:858 length:261 start_codon:yes stop_codon:yes gene_type:complete